MEKITKGAVKNGESKRETAAEAGGGESEFLLGGICYRCSSLRTLMGMDLDLV